MVVFVWSRRGRENVDKGVWEIIIWWTVLTGEARIDTSYCSYKQVDKITHKNLAPQSLETLINTDTRVSQNVLG